MMASRAFFEEYESWLEDHLLVKVQHYSKQFNQIREMVEYRTSLLEQSTRLEPEEVSLAGNLVEKVKEFDGRFVEDWKGVHVRFEGEY